MALKDYLATEVGEDWADGIVSRREALRRLALLGLSLTSAIALLEACAPVRGAGAQGGGRPASRVSSGHRAASAAARPSAGTGQGSGESASATAGSSGS